MYNFPCLRSLESLNGLLFSFTVVESVCSRTHKVNGQDLDVKAISKHFACQLERGEHILFKIPASVEIQNLDAKKLHFLSNSPFYRQALEKELKAVYGKPIWPEKSKSSSLTIQCTLTAEAENCQMLPRTWEAKVKETLHRFLDLLLVTKHPILPEAFHLVIDETKRLHTSNPYAVAIILERKGYVIYVTGLKEAVKELTKQVDDIIDLIYTSHRFTQGEVLNICIGAKINPYVRIH